METAQRNYLAESIVASREAAQGRPFDGGYRARFTTFPGLEAAWLSSRICRTAPAETPGRVFGAATTDLVFTPVTPCRAFDTRSAIAGIMTTDSERNFFITGRARRPSPTRGARAEDAGFQTVRATAVMIKPDRRSQAGSQHERRLSSVGRVEPATAGARRLRRQFSAPPLRGRQRGRPADLQTRRRRAVPWAIFEYAPTPAASTSSVTSWATLRRRSSRR